MLWYASIVSCTKCSNYIQLFPSVMTRSYLKDPKISKHMKFYTTINDVHCVIEKTNCSYSEGKQNCFCVWFCLVRTLMIKNVCFIVRIKHLDPEKTNTSRVGVYHELQQFDLLQPHCSSPWVALTVVAWYYYSL